MRTTTNRHCRDCGAAVNVKTHGVRFSEGGTEAQREIAEEYTRQSFWNRANDLAKAAGYGGATACGRSGGWCAPYYGTAVNSSVRFETNADAPAFSQFHDGIDALMREVPDLFAAHLSRIIAEHDQRETRRRERVAKAARAEASRVDTLRIAALMLSHPDVPAFVLPASNVARALRRMAGLSVDDIPEQPGEAFRVDGTEIVFRDHDNGGEAWHVIRNAGDEWAALAAPDWSARVCDALNLQPVAPYDVRAATPAGEVPGALGQWLPAARCAVLGRALHGLLDVHVSGAASTHGYTDAEAALLRGLADDMEHAGAGGSE